MTQKSIEIFTDEINSKPPKKNYSTNKTDVYHIDDICSWDILDLEDYHPGNFRKNSCLFVIIDNFSKFGETKPLKNKNSQTVNNSFENIILISKRKLNIIKTDRRKEFS